MTEKEPIIVQSTIMMKPEELQAWQKRVAEQIEKDGVCVLPPYLEVVYPQEQEPCEDAISREDAIAWYCDKQCQCGCDKGIRRKCRSLKGLIALPSVTPSRQWIPVSKRLPEEAFGCLVTILDTDLRTQDEFENVLPYTVGYDGETWNNFCGEPIPFEVVAWMKLPEPYKAEMESEE